MADVYLALREGAPGELAVVKRLRESLAEDTDLVAMILDEALITARLDHPHVVKLLDAGTDDDVTFLAMEFLDGQPLSRLERHVTKAGAATIQATLPMRLLVLSDVLAGLDYAHDLVDEEGAPLALVHRDVNPQNVFVTYDGVAKLLDFGVAKAAGRACQTAIGTIKGKLRYMSPEQVMGREIDRRSDIFAVGVMLWQTLTRTRFWGDVQELDIVRALASTTFDASPRAVRSDVPEELDAICRRALARNARDRYAHARDMRDDIDRFLAPYLPGLRARLADVMRGMFTEDRRQMEAIVGNARGGQYTERDDEELDLLEFNTAMSASIQATLQEFALPKSGGFETPARLLESNTATSLPAMAASVAPQGDVGLAEFLEPAAAPRSPTYRALATTCLVAGAAAAALALAATTLQPSILATAAGAQGTETRIAAQPTKDLQILAPTPVRRRSPEQAPREPPAPPPTAAPLTDP